MFSEWPLSALLSALLSAQGHNSSFVTTLSMQCNATHTTYTKLDTVRQKRRQWDKSWPDKGGHIRRKISNTTTVTKSVHQNSVTVRQRWAQFGKALNVMGHRNHHCQMKRKIQNFLVPHSAPPLPCKRMWWRGKERGRCPVKGDPDVGNLHHRGAAHHLTLYNSDHHLPPSVIFVHNCHEHRITLLMTIVF